MAKLGAMPSRKSWRPRAADPEQAALVSRALASLNPNQREVVYLRYYEGWSEGEIGERLGFGPRTVRYHLAQAAKRLVEWRDPEGSS